MDSFIKDPNSPQFNKISNFSVGTNILQAALALDWEGDNLKMLKRIKLTDETFAGR